MKQATIKVFINSSSPDKAGKCSVTLRVTFQREKKYYPIISETDKKPVKLTVSEFNNVMAPNSSHKKTKIEKGYYHDIHAAESRAERIRISLPTFTWGLFELAYKGNSAPVNSIKAGFQKYINELREEGRVGTAVTYECAMKSMEAYKPGMKFGDLTAQELKKYERWMLTRKEGPSSKATVGIYLRSLRSIFNQADVDRSLYPFGKGRNKYTIPTGRNLKKALHLSEIAKIFRYEAPAGSTEEMARDYWVFMYLCNGMNLKDLCQLKRKNINGDLLTYNRAKTINSRKDSQSILVSLKPEAKAIISKWGQVSLDPESFVFPHLKRGITSTDEREIIQQLNKTINKYMKRIAEVLEIDKPVTTYYARHSFATVLKRAGTSTEMISELLRHSSTQMTENYLDGFEHDQIHEATNVLTAFK